MATSLRSENGAEVMNNDTLNKLEIVLDVLCELADRQITVFLPTNQEEQIPYIKKEIIKTLEQIQ